MSRISKVLRQADDGHGGRSLLFYCIGCGMAHHVNVGTGPGPRWGFNENPDKPTFTPSILVRWGQWTPPAYDPEVAEKIKSGEIVQTKVEMICHTFITDGRIHYLSDCTHAFAGQTIDLPEFRWGEDDPDEASS